MGEEGHTEGLGEAETEMNPVNNQLQTIPLGYGCFTLALCTSQLWI